MPDTKRLLDMRAETANSCDSLLGDFSEIVDRYDDTTSERSFSTVELSNRNLAQTKHISAYARPQFSSSHRCRTKELDEEERLPLAVYAHPDRDLTAEHTDQVNDIPDDDSSVFEADEAHASALKKSVIPRRPIGSKVADIEQVTTRCEPMLRSRSAFVNLSLKAYMAPLERIGSAHTPNTGDSVICNPVIPQRQISIEAEPIKPKKQAISQRTRYDSPEACDK